MLTAGWGIHSSGARFPFSFPALGRRERSPRWRRSSAITPCPGLPPGGPRARRLSNARRRRRSHAQHGEEPPFDRRAREGRLICRRGGLGWADTAQRDRLRRCQNWMAGAALTLNGQVGYRPRAPHRAGHECGGSIPPIADFVHVRPAAPNGPGNRLPGSFYAPVAMFRCSSAPAATGARSIAPKAVRGKRAAARNAPPAGATR